MPTVQNLPPATLPVVAFVAFIILVALIRSTRARSACYTYHRKPLLSSWERSAFSTLAVQLRPGQHLCPQVRLADLLKVDAPDQKGFWAGFNPIAQKSLDFVVVDLASGEAVLAIELDDKTHDRADRQKRDSFVKHALHEAGVPLVRFRPRQRLDIQAYLTGTRVEDLGRLTAAE